MSLINFWKSFISRQDDQRHETWKFQKAEWFFFSHIVSSAACHWHQKHEMCYWSEFPVDTEMWRQLKSCSWRIHSWTGQVRQTNNAVWRWITAWKWVPGLSFSFHRLLSCRIHHMIYCTADELRESGVHGVVKLLHKHINKNITERCSRTIKSNTSWLSSITSDLLAFFEVIWSNWITAVFVVFVRYIFCLLCWKPVMNK